MKKYILGTKQIMTQLFTDEGVCVPVTIVAAAPCVVTQVKTLKTDGYNAVQIGYGKRKISRLTKAEIGQRKKLGDFSKLKEFRVTDVANYKIGDQLTVKQFTAGDKVKISGISKGKGFQGVVRRHHFKGAPVSHGHKDQLRKSGSIGATAPQRVLKGTRMAGHMGVDKVTVPHMQVVKVDEQTNQIYLKGALPGARQALVEIQA